ncbi:MULTISPECIES: IS110 family transposase [unclassified Spirosoma]|uniref:IS110 family transposase n=1 Tax=unclassified Spirosoma TaxID=2621999 RepID=UPI0009698130|nr:MULTISPECIES: IS110 family transposase [unclassified Spirosoma]MBN8820556.1 IS110 family transposase [Spirosoma sp.]OJW77706.1 MAG: IS110 family transposase [Spirosoma sp. 48-14]PHK08508.1 transposase [Nostoc linckia z14]
MDVQYYIGIDVSKATLDWAVFNGKTIVLQTQSLNSVAAIKATIKALKSLPGFTNTQSVFCLEHTGVYNAHILDQLMAHQLPTWLESSLHIKQAGGLQRGKSDSIDAQRIAEYAYRFRDRMRLWQPPRQLLQELVILSALRQRLLLVRQQLQVPVNEQAAFVSTKLQKQLTRHCQASLKSINADLEQVSRQMDELIHQDQQLCELFKLMTSVPGVGPAVATEVILATDEFKNFSEPKKLACHAGVAPFEHSSGSSIRGRSRVNQHARKRLKFLFHLAAMSAIRVKGELQTYYQRKVAEGKNKMSILNAVRNKLIHRICAVVKRKQKYDIFYPLSFV